MNLNDVVANVTNFNKDGCKIVMYGVCLRVAGFQPNEILDGAIIGNDEITPKLFTNATVVTYWGLTICEIKLYDVYLPIFFDNLKISF